MKKSYEYFNKKTKGFRETQDITLAKRNAHKGTLINISDGLRLKFNSKTKRWRTVAD